MYNKPSRPASKTYEKKPVVKKPRVIRDWSKLQLDVFANLENGVGNLQVDAKAGSGKTATLVECTFRIPDSKSILACAFNNSIQKELDERVKPGCVVQTLHSVGFAALRNAFKFVQIDNDGKLRRHIDKFVSDDLEYASELKPILKKTVDLCKCNLAHSYNDIINVVDKYGIEVDCIPEDRFVGLVINIMNSCKSEKTVIDFTDMIWLPVVLNLSFAKYDYVFIDEAQDLNKCQTEIALKSVKSGGRIISLGDEFQAIYGFAGADSNSIPNIVSRLNSKRLPLSISYRCPKNIIKKAQEIVPSIEYAPNAKDGQVIDLPEDKLIETVKKKDVILSRTNAKLVSICMRLLKNKIPAKIVGRDIGNGLTSLVKKSKAKDINSLIEYINAWKTKECDKLIARDKDCSNIIDKAECIVALSEECETVQDLLNTLENLFSDDSSDNVVTLSSVHRFKGKEADNVFVMTSTLRYSNQEEKNIAYVAFTRSLDTMYNVA